MKDPKLTELLSSIDKRIKVNGLLDEDPSAVSDIDKYDGVVLVSEVNKTNTRRFEREVEIARKLNKDIIGFISVR